MEIRRADIAPQLPIDDARCLPPRSPKNPSALPFEAFFGL
jgi:hypothetical protein